jgi:hypothetical protein
MQNQYYFFKHIVIMCQIIIQQPLLIQNLSFITMESKYKCSFLTIFR